MMPNPAQKIQAKDMSEAVITNKIWSGNLERQRHRCITTLHRGSCQYLSPSRWLSGKASVSIATDPGSNPAFPVSFSLSYLHLRIGFVHLLYDVALHQCQNFPCRVISSSSHRLCPSRGFPTRMVYLDSLIVVKIYHSGRKPWNSTI